MAKVTDGLVVVDITIEMHSIEVSKGPRGLLGPPQSLSGGQLLAAKEFIFVVKVLSVGK